jgi:hypothetical protein
MGIRAFPHACMLENAELHAEPPRVLERLRNGLFPRNAVVQVRMKIDARDLPGGKRRHHRGGQTSQQAAPRQRIPHIQA